MMHSGVSKSAKV